MKRRKQSHAELLWRTKRNALREAVLAMDLSYTEHIFNVNATMEFRLNALRLHDSALQVAQHARQELAIRYPDIIVPGFNWMWGSYAELRAHLRARSAGRA